MISQEHLLMAIFSQIAYDYYPIRACKCQKINERIEISLENAKLHHKDLSDIQSYKYISHGFGTAFRSEEKKHVVIAFTGTDFALPFSNNCCRIIEEIVDDLTIYFFDEPTNCTLKRAMKFVNQIKTQYLGYSFTITGHSLGGNIAERVAYQTKDPCISYNAFGSAFIYMTKPRDLNTLSLRGTMDGLSFRKLTELSSNTILFKDFPHKVSSWTGSDFYYVDKKPENKMNFIINGLLALILVLIFLPFITLFGIIFCLFYFTCVKPKKRRDTKIKYISQEELQNIIVVP